MRAKQKFKLSATIIGICFLLHGIPAFAMWRNGMGSRLLPTIYGTRAKFSRRIKVWGSKVF